MNSSGSVRLHRAERRLTSRRVAAIRNGEGDTSATPKASGASLTQWQSISSCKQQNQNNLRRIWCCGTGAVTARKTSLTKTFWSSTRYLYDTRTQFQTEKDTAGSVISLPLGRFPKGRVS